jgi:hypothetical protein
MLDLNLMVSHYVFRIVMFSAFLATSSARLLKSLRLGGYEARHGEVGLHLIALPHGLSG